MTTLQEACVKALDSLEQWAALIKHQYTGTSEGMTDLQLADNAGMLAIEVLKTALAQQGEQAIGYVRTVNGEPTPDDNNTIFSYGANPYRDVMGNEEWVAVYTAAPSTKPAEHKPNCSECAKFVKEQADNREWLEGVAKGNRIVAALAAKELRCRNS